MTITGINGNILDAKTDVIMHQVNCFTIGSGVAKAIIDKYPIVLEKHQKFCEDNNHQKDLLLGKVQPIRVSDTQVVVNLFSQYNYGNDGKRYTSYDSLMTCLEKTAKYCADKGLTSVALPFRMCSDRGGANWDVVWAMVKAAFKDTNVAIEVWRLQPQTNES